MIRRLVFHLGDRKTGSTSITQGLFGGIGAEPRIEHGVFRPEWRSAFVFAFVRNPWARPV